MALYTWKLRWQRTTTHKCYFVNADNNTTPSYWMSMNGYACFLAGWLVRSFFSSSQSLPDDPIATTTRTVRPRLSTTSVIDLSTISIEGIERRALDEFFLLQAQSNSFDWSSTFCMSSLMRPSNAKESTDGLRPVWRRRCADLPRETHHPSDHVSILSSRSLFLFFPYRSLFSVCACPGLPIIQKEKLDHFLSSFFYCVKDVTFSVITIKIF